MMRPALSMLFPLRCIIITLLLFVTTTMAQVSECGTAGSKTSVAGSILVSPLAMAWANGYQSSCGNSQVVVDDDGGLGDSSYGAQKVCGYASGESGADIGLLTRDFYNTESSSSDGFRYRCQRGNTSRTSIKLAVAIDATVVAVSATGVAASCITSLGGLTMGQLRWIYSNYTLSRLLATGLRASEVPNSDGYDGTHLWSELGGAGCAATEIVIAREHSGDLYQFFVSEVLTDSVNGETTRSPIMFMSNSFLTLNSNGIAYLEYSDYLEYFNDRRRRRRVSGGKSGGSGSGSGRGPIIGVPLQNRTNRAFYTPDYANMQSRAYPLSFYLYSEVRSDSLPILAKQLLPYISFGFSPQGDTLVKSTGLVPLAPETKALTLSRGFAVVGPALNRCTCSASRTTVTMAGDRTTWLVAAAWSSLYKGTCPGKTVTLGASTSTSGAARVCGVAPAVDIGLMDRNFLPSEAVLAHPRSTNTFTYNCTGRKGRILRQVPVAKHCITPTSCRVHYMNLNAAYLSLKNTAALVKCGYTTAGNNLVLAAGLKPMTKADQSKIMAIRLQLPPCFSGNNQVELWGKGVVAMQDLLIGDWVRNAKGQFDQIYSFGHYAPYQEAEFLQLHFRGGILPLEITSQHMLLVQGKHAIPAWAVEVGDQVVLATSGAVHEIQAIKRVVRTGAFAPYTRSGTIAVNQVPCSAYIDIQPGNNKDNAGILMLGGTSTLLTMQFVAHVLQAPHRLICKLSFRYCLGETYDEHGIPTWVAAPLEAAEGWIQQESAVVMAVAFIPLLVMVVFVHMAEMVLASIKIFAIVIVLLTWMTVCLGKKTLRSKCFT